MFFLFNINLLLFLNTSLQFFSNNFLYLSNTKFPVRYAYQVVKVFEELEVQEKIYNEHREKLLKAYGKYDKKKDQYHFEGKKAEQFRQELEELLNKDFSINAKLIQLPDNIELSPAQIQALEDILDLSNMAS